MIGICFAIPFIVVTNILAIVISCIVNSYTLVTTADICHACVPSKGDQTNPVSAPHHLCIKNFESIHQ